MRLRGATAVSVGILGSRVLGFLRESVFAHYFGNGDAADAFRAALRIPNLLQNLFGEGALSASFIPVYAKLRADGKEEDARVVARAVFFLLFGVSSIVALLGIVFAPILVDLITPGFVGEKRALAIQLVQILFPGTSLLVLSAWCLGIQNSHRKFLLSYSAPMLWNLAIIGALFLFGRKQDGILLVTVGVTVGSALQFLIQLPVALQLIGTSRGTISRMNDSVKQVLRNFLPVAFSRGVAQVSAFVDSMIASLLQAGSVSVLGYAQTLYLLPISLFGMSVSAAELPELSERRDEAFEAIRLRVERGMDRILYFVFPSTAAFIFIGDRLIALVFETGQFSSADTYRVWLVLGTLAAALPFTTISRLFSSLFYSRHQARELLWVSISRVTLSATLGYLFASPLEMDLFGLCLGATIGAYYEFFVLALLFGRSGLQLPRFSKLSRQLALLSLLCGIAAHTCSRGYPRIEGAVIALITFGVPYLGIGELLRRRVRVG